MPIFTSEQEAAIRCICKEEIAGGVPVDTGTDPWDIIAGPDALGAVQYRAMKGVNVFDPQLLRDKKIPLTERQINNIAQNAGTDGDGNLGETGVPTGRLVPESIKTHPELFWPAPSREQRLGLLSFCREYVWDDKRKAWVQSGDTLVNYTAFRTEDTKTGVQLLKEHF